MVTKYTSIIIRKDSSSSGLYYKNILTIVNETTSWNVPIELSIMILESSMRDYQLPVSATRWQHWSQIYFATFIY